MAVLKVKTAASRDILIPSHSANLLLDCQSAEAALLYIYILSHGGELDISAASKRLKLKEEAINDALKVLEAKGIVGKTEAPKPAQRSDAVPDYTQKDIAERMGSDGQFKQLVAFCENALGKYLSSYDIQVLLSIYDWLGLPFEVACLLITSCVDEAHKKLGPGRVPTLRTIEKRAKEWVAGGILTLGRAEEYLREMEKLGEEKGRIAAILRITGRALSPTEEKYIAAWVASGISHELIEIAYDKTVVNTGSLKWNYMNKILAAWHELGYRTAEDLVREERKEPQATATIDEGAAAKLRELNRKKREKREEQ
ncbi:MAG: DnaD domain protein [Oscillospiraceae bacterium]|nr:DnaD domain protein [Oscillospiraceae bacterium]